MSGAGSKASKRRLIAREREQKALTLRMAGATYAQIAEQLGVTPQGAHKIVMRVLKNLNEKIAEQGEEVRRLEVERLDKLLLGIWHHATKGNQGAIDRVLRIMKRRAELLGLDAPTRQDITSGGEPLIIVNWDADASAND